METVFLIKEHDHETNNKQIQMFSFFCRIMSIHSLSLKLYTCPME